MEQGIKDQLGAELKANNLTAFTVVKILSKIEPEIFRRIQDLSTPTFTDTSHIPFIYSQFSSTFDFDADPLIKKLKFISIVLSLYSPASLVAEINVAHGVRANLAAALGCNDASGVSHLIARARVYMKGEGFKGEVENVVRWITDNRDN